MTPRIFPEVQIDNNTFEVIIDGTELNVNKDHVNQIIGYTDNNSHAYFDDYIDELLLNLPKHVRIKSGYRIVDTEKPADNKKGMLINSTLFALERIVTSQLRKAEQAAVFLCSIGQELENRSKTLLKEDDAALGYIVNTVASEAVENATNLLHDHIGQKMQELGLHITNRYSPGYCKWPVSEQHKLFSLLPDQFCDIQLTGSALMIPIKSVSGIIGIGKNVTRVDYLCDWCNVKDCTYRMIKSREAGNPN
jgi:hypothetical protein